MTYFRTAAVAAALTLGAALPAPAMTVADLASGKIYAASVGGLGDELLAGAPTGFGARESQAAAATYFDYDALITLGALALAGGGLAAMAAAARRKAARAEDSEEPAWRESVFRALQADLAQFTANYRHAA